MTEEQREKKRAYMREYNKREERRAYMREYMQRPEVKARRRVIMREYTRRRRAEDPEFAERVREAERRCYYRRKAKKAEQ